MYLQINDGVAIFATHIILTTIPEGARGKLAPFQLEPNGIVVYPDQNVLDMEWTLRELKIPYTVESIQPDPAHTAKADGVKYTSRSEAIAHLLENKEPESQKLPNLMKRLADKDAEIATLRAERDTEMAALKNELTALKGLLQTK